MFFTPALGDLGALLGGGGAGGLGALAGLGGGLGALGGLGGGAAGGMSYVLSRSLLQNILYTFCTSVPYLLITLSMSLS